MRSLHHSVCPRLCWEISLFSWENDETARVVLASQQEKQTQVKDFYVLTNVLMPDVT